MAHGREEFALVGYSEDLERKPLKFVDPIPSSRICSACCNVPRLMLMLVCGNNFCESCYNSCSTISECVCPMDGDSCAIADISSKEYPAEQLLRRTVRCWNEANGCAVLPASQVAEHIRHDCRYHVTRCPNFTADVLCSDVCAHLKSQCTTLVLHAAPEALQGTNNHENAYFVAFERKVEQRVRELDSRLAQLSFETGTHNDKLVEVCHNINNLKEAQTEQFERASVDMKALAVQEKTIENRVGQLEAKLTQLSLKSGSQSGKLVDVCRNISNLKEAVTQQFGNLKEALTQQFGPSSDRNAAEMRALYKEKKPNP
ncbi:uncharacterized protein LOC144145679 isoform X1 [Haemaphysalis longicornis]